MTGLLARVRARAGALVLDVEVAAGRAQPVAVVGPNGAGKTTLLLSILGVHPVDGGQVALDGERLFDDAARIDVPVEERRIAYVPQDYALFPHLTARHNVELALACLRPPPAARERRRRAQQLLERLGAADFADRLPRALSGGQRQRVALARALATEPRALLFDEPFAALDAAAREEVRGELRAWLAELRLPALVVTHDRRDVEALEATVAVLERGQVVQRGPFADLAARPATDYVRRFVAAGAVTSAAAAPAP
jgi:molybdate transport system ATP-binding protein